MLETPSIVDLAARAAQDQANAAIAVQPAPLPTAVNLGQTRGHDGSLWVILQFQTPQGLSVFHLPAESGKQLGEGLLKLSQMTASGLHAAGGRP